MPSHARQLSFLTSGERDSTVEHLVHVSRLQTVESVQFSKRKQAFEAPPPSSAMLNRHERRAAQEDARIRQENQILWEKIESQARYGDKLQREALDKLRHQKESYAGSNRHRRLQEAKRIDHDNRVLYDRIVAASPRVTPRSEMTRVAAMQEQQARLKSKFKPTAEMPRPPRAPYPDDDDEDANNAASSSNTPRLPRVPGAAGSTTSARGLSTHGAGTDVGPGWSHVTPADVRRRERDRDRKMKGHPALPAGDGSDNLGTRQRTHNASGWCDRDAAHKQHVERVKSMAQDEEAAAAAGYDDHYGQGDDYAYAQIA